MIYIPNHKRPQTLGEEIANAVSHGFGMVAAAVVTPFLIYNAVQRGGAPEIVGASIFAAALIFLYLASVLYHAVPHDKAKRIFRLVDHGAIYFLIAGTYTPFVLGPLRGPWGWSLFAIVWALAVAGLTLTLAGGMRYPKVIVGLYLFMGWLVVIAIRPLWMHMPAAGVYWLAAGGLAYTIGVPFYTARNLRYTHFVWHLFVLAGTACHCVAVLLYAA